ncbi:type II toxin-antitoxin system VapC family toxin [Streptomyces sp. NPDC002073]|uniref:type II toxin-antitoxin system VapC family toxin n=1 Tax=Streptomyces sp. NBC_00239 TaxID=2903640 RepID=UPI002E296C69|nr:type II toxin-antitoxin system VapC family toxin [Streptomyces sp. NBC_00239]
MIVIDASAVVMLVADAGPVGEAVRERTLGERLAAPFLLDVEVAQALLGRHRGGKLSDHQLDVAWEHFAALPVRRMEHVPVLPRVRELYANLSAYDATYVALAEGLQVPLITCDARIVRSGSPRCKIDVFG